MSFNGSGVYTLPGAQLANGATISATENNQFRNDVATALNTCWTRDGQAPATANIPMASHKFTGLAAGTGAGDSVRYEQVTSAVAITGGTITGLTSIDLPDNTVQTADIANSAVTAAKLAIDAVETAKIKDASVETAKIKDANVTPAKLSTGAPTWDASGNVTVGTSLKFPDNTTQSTAATSYVGPGAQVFTSSGTFTIPAGVTKLKMYVTGGGGTGDYTGGGGGGGTAIKWLSNLTPSKTLSVTVGGTGGTSSVASGTQTITTVSATGGGNASGQTGGSGGSGSNGDLNLDGAGGVGPSGVVGDSATREGGAGGSSFWGGGARGQGGSTGQNGGNYGGGGSGYGYGGSTVGTGAGGVVVFEW